MAYSRVKNEALRIMQQVSGQATFYQVYNWLVKVKKVPEDAPSIKLKIPARTQVIFGRSVRIPPEEVVFLMHNLRAWAFEEIMEHLPTADDVQKIHRIMDGDYRPHMKVEAIEILNKIPTK